MHPVWLINDIRLLIFECLEPGDLSRLSQTCKALFDPGTEELWKTVRSFSPFLSCLPPDFGNRPLRIEDLQRLDFYASKVRNLILESKSMKYVIRLPAQFQLKKKHSETKSGKTWEELWKEIANLRPTSKFLRNLQRIRISNVVEELLIPLIGISGTNVIQVYIKYIHNRQSKSVVLKFLNQIQDTSNLEYLFVRDGEPDLLPTKLIQRSPLKHLRVDPRLHAERHQDIQYKQFPLRHEILEKSTLKHLTIGLTREWYSPNIDAMSGKYLPNLKTLWLNLTAFKTDKCIQSCVNVTAHDWTCSCSGPPDNEAKPTDCGRRAPTVFLEGLDNPELDLLNIKFPPEATGRMFLAIVSAAKRRCRLGNLTDLALAGGGWIGNCDECGKRPSPAIEPTELRAALNMLLPMPHLKILRISVAPNFLDVLDLDLYHSITNGLPTLEKLSLGHPQFLAVSLFEGTTFYERVPLHHLAAFCSMLPNLKEVGVGTVDGLLLEERPRVEWTCTGVESLTIHHWAGRNGSGGVSRNFLHLGLRTYFPNSDLAKIDFSPRYYFFDPED